MRDFYGILILVHGSVSDKMRVSGFKCIDFEKRKL